MADIVWLDSTTSTNLVVKEANGLLDGAVAFSQTQGRGRLGRTFHSPYGGIYMSFLVRGDAVSLSQDLVTARAAVAVKRALLEVAGVKAGIKWVNDLYLDGRKVCGILTEACPFGAVVGIGINWDTPSDAFPEDLRDKAGSVFKDVRPLSEKRLFAEKVREHLKKVMVDVQWIDEYAKADILAGCEVDVIRAGCVVAHGKAVGIDGNAALHVMTQNGELVLSTGEVSIRFEQQAV